MVTTRFGNPVDILSQLLEDAGVTRDFMGLRSQPYSSLLGGNCLKPIAKFNPIFRFY